MFKAISIGLSVGLALIVFAAVMFFVGLYNAPQPRPLDEMDHIQQICDAMRKEPWKTEIEASCLYLQDFWAIDYKCEEIRGCYSQARNNYGESNNQRQQSIF